MTVKNLREFLEKVDDDTLVILDDPDSWDSYSPTTIRNCWCDSNGENYHNDESKGGKPAIMIE